MLEIKDLYVRYGMIEAIKGISFEVRDGEIVTLIGSNGAGKTTTMHAISGLLKPASGSIMLDGVELTKTPHMYRKEDVYLPSRRLKRICFLGHTHEKTRTASRKISNMSMTFFQDFWKERNSWQVHCQVVNRRCLPWQER